MIKIDYSQLETRLANMEHEVSKLRDINKKLSSEIFDNSKRVDSLESLIKHISETQIKHNTSLFERFLGTFANKNSRIKETTVKLDN